MLKYYLAFFMLVFLHFFLPGAATEMANRLQLLFLQVADHARSNDTKWAQSVLYQQEMDRNLVIPAKWKE